MTIPATHDRPERHDRRPRSQRLRVTGALMAVGLLAVLAGCTPGSPQAVLNVPGTYVADLQHPPIGIPPGDVYATVLMCLDTRSAVFQDTGPGGDGSVGSIRLEWVGAVFPSPSASGPATLPTPVLEPGCGQLTFGVDCCRVEHFLAIRATKV